MNKYYSIIAPAKLNLNLFVNGRYKNGLHLLDSDICFLELSDKIFFKFNEYDTFLQNKANISLQVNTKSNLILESLNAFRKLTGWDKRFQIYLDKKIPIGAGLGGGSANAAATLILLRKLYNDENSFQKLSLSSLYQIGRTLGSDIPSCLESKDLKLRGTGNKISRIKIPNNYFFLIINPNINLSTSDVFKHFSFLPNEQERKNYIFFENIKIYNSLLSSAIHLAPSISNILLFLKNIPNIVAYGMTGSGSSCFGIFNDINDILSFKNNFNKKQFIWYGKRKNYSVNRVCSFKTLENNF